MHPDSYLLFLLISAVLVVADGQLIYRSGREYLDQSGEHAASARSATQLVTVLFHLIMLGLLALMASIPFSTGNPVRDLVVRLGIALLMLAAAHAGTIAILGQIRQNQYASARSASRRKPPREWGSHPTVNPVSDGPSDRSAVSPAIDSRGPYTTPD
ncbi:hypothetical protein [Tamaricihabitans halophyticus]|uniref:hypothetical protein n=1 Tax=Tamaricihabitans halophyticus TaxID=1262583 RepID=UPI00104D4499|nr:hypothetical protein [Tamaricihabitans halophyticus]